MSLKQWWRGKRPYLLSGLIYSLASGIGTTLRVEQVDAEKLEKLGSAKMLLGWHGRTMVAANVYKGRGYWAIISQSRDGEMQTRIFKKFGFQIIRGSTKRGGVQAAIDSIRVLQEGGTMAFTPDGPRGPSGIVQPGLLLIARKSGAAIVPVGVSARWRWLAPTWDRYLVPFPFSRCVMIYGDPIYLPEDADDEEQERVRQLVEQEMHRLEVLAEQKMGHEAQGKLPHHASVDS
jgi:lysophospholipid acyltransferase (LPLAT)-like uncharacterized protein